MNVSWLTDILTSIKDMSIKKIIVVFICIYPLFASFYFKDELKLMFVSSDIKVEVSNVNKLVQTTHNIKDKFKATSVLVFLYQPSGDVKKYKERICFSGDSRNVFFELTKEDLIRHPKLLNDVNHNDYVLVNSVSNHTLSKLMSVYNVVAYIIPIRNDYGLITAEVMVVFDNEISNLMLNELINSTELIRISM